MPPATDILTPITIAVNGIAITFALVMLLIILWNDSRTAANWFFALCVGMVMLWSLGTILGGVEALIGSADLLTDVGGRLTAFGFIGACIGLYLYITYQVESTSRALRIGTTTISVFLLMVQGVTIFSAAPPPALNGDRFGAFGALLYGSFIGAALLSAWTGRKRFNGGSLIAGVILFSIGAGIELLSPQLRARAISINIAVFGTVLMCIATIYAQIIAPLTGRAQQLQAVRDVGVAITSRVNIQNVQEILGTIAAQAAEILNADGAAIFLRDENGLELAAVHNMPAAFVHKRLMVGEGLVGKAVAQRQTFRLESYRRDWAGVEDMPFAKISFGSVLAAPLIFADEVVGSLFIVAGPNGKRFDRDDAQLVDLVSPQAAVAVINSRLFQRQLALARQLEAAKSQLETLLFSAQNPIIALNRRLEIIFSNPAAQDLLRGQPDESRLGNNVTASKSLPDSLFTGKSLLTLPGIEQMMPIQPMHVARELRRKRVYTYEATIHDRTYLCHVGLLAQASPHDQGYVVVLNEISELKELDALKNQMIRMTSHDLKNPLMAAILHVEEMSELAASGSLQTDQIGDGLNVVYQQLERMQRIIRSILDLERLQSGVGSRGAVDLTAILTRVTSELQADADRAGVQINLRLPEDFPPVPGDQHYLARAFANLIENAIKFTRSGGQISVGAERDSNFAIIHVADTGLGIPHAAQGRLFERFYRANQPGAEQITGTGLGLSLVKSVVAAHKGRIWLESEPGQGTTFHLALPVR